MLSSRRLKHLILQIVESGDGSAKESQEAANE
jgi:hypothetical protein